MKIRVCLLTINCIGFLIVVRGRGEALGLLISGGASIITLSGHMRIGVISDILWGLGIGIPITYWLLRRAKLYTLTSSIYSIVANY